MKVREVMTMAPAYCRADTSLAAAAEMKSILWMPFLHDVLVQVSGQHPNIAS
jgi:hypothetical protein